MQGDILKTMNDEIDEGAALLRPHYPEATPNQLRDRAMCMRADRYKDGHWPSDEELARRMKNECLSEYADVEPPAAA